MPLADEQKESLRTLMYKYLTLKVVSPGQDTFNPSVELMKNPDDRKEIENLLASASDNDFNDSFYGGILEGLKTLIELQR